MGDTLMFHTSLMKNIKYNGMRKFKLIILFVVLSFNIYCQNIRSLILINPTVLNVKSIDYLLKNNYITIPNLKIIGLYNKNQNYDFSQTQDWIMQNNASYFEMQGYDLNINTDSLFLYNKCSKIFKEIFEKSDGIIFTGGDDIPPFIYMEKTKLQTEILDYERLYEMSFLFHLLGRENSKGDVKPLLLEKPNYCVVGICLGMQSLNVACGGTLYQDIPSEIYGFQTFEDVLKLPKDNQHKNYSKRISYTKDNIIAIFHEIKISKDFIKFLNINSTQNPIVASVHHQCVKRLPDSFYILATSIDGKVIESIKHKTFKNVIGVQFHPEYTKLYETKQYQASQTIEFGKAFWHWISCGF